MDWDLLPQYDAIPQTRAGESGEAFVASTGIATAEKWGCEVREPTEQQECCTIDNLDQATSDGELNARVNVLVCRTCGYQDSFAYCNNDEMNCLYSYVTYTVERVGFGLPVYSPGFNLRPPKNGGAK